MNFIEKIMVIERLDQLIRTHATGNPEELAKRIGVSRSTIYEIIECMRNLGAKIEYDKQRQSFFYRDEMQLYLRYKNKNDKFSSSPRN